MFNMSEIIELAVRIEENGERVYRDASGSVSDPSLASWLKWLADEEREHVQWFRELKETVKETPVDPEVAEMGRSLLLEIVGDQTFSLAEEDLATVDGLKELLKIALDFEKDTVIFYEMMGSFVQDEAPLGKLRQIIQEENRHVDTLAEFLQKGRVASIS